MKRRDFLAAVGAVAAMIRVLAFCVRNAWTAAEDFEKLGPSFDQIAKIRRPKKHETP